MQKQILEITTAGEPHMVGDGFKPRNFIDRRFWKQLSPFLMLDYNEPWALRPTDHPRGVDVHPHKGFETVTIAWEGVLAHEDSSGGSGIIGPGDVQWMTAGSGILHKEFHEASFSRQGGVLHMAQLWINLPASAKNVAPAYQDLRKADIPVVPVANDGGQVRVIAGTHRGTEGPARTHTRVGVLDVYLNAGATETFTLTEGDHAALVVMKGNLLIHQQQQLRTGQMAVLDAQGTTISVESNNEAHLLLLYGEPIHEPIAAYGPFVMNTPAEIQQAIADYQAGKFGHLT